MFNNFPSGTTGQAQFQTENFAIQDSDQHNTFSITGNATGDTGLITFGGSSNPLKFILNQAADKYTFEGGNVGIGTTSPPSTLTVQGNSIFTGNINAYGNILGANFTATGTLSVASSTPDAGSRAVIQGTTTIGLGALIVDDGRFSATSTFEVGSIGRKRPACINMVYATGASTYATSSMYINTAGVLTVETNACK